ncbi:uncharacterized protein BDR25DRAFT_348244 [Lindgomyces ingoldianus]|uniref:Uncharacterized protein n=1 Tax=Lindgomyces ingoldianus TaxID=673940 RepID=A0ACB6RGP6_9PLEO|nr:uncharacterized protein BDR25DRAFT_348244 [Lindgomyces ingoldianus]KAF2477953.1 hypothetical protein BDR25DRAFT_348244 [Lindgomyces ingoldianus]
MSCSFWAPFALMNREGNLLCLNIDGVFVECDALFSHYFCFLGSSYKRHTRFEGAFARKPSLLVGNQIKRFWSRLGMARKAMNTYLRHSKRSCRAGLPHEILHCRRVNLTKIRARCWPRRLLIDRNMKLLYVVALVADWELRAFQRANTPAAITSPAKSTMYGNLATCYSRLDFTATEYSKESNLA